VRLPDALRQLYAACNGFCVRGGWTWGFYIYPLIEEGGSGPLDNQVVTTGGDTELIETWYGVHSRQCAQLHDLTQ
jgi:hypothetical protein